jgi:hypothetical protein
MRASQAYVVVASALAVGIAWWLFERDPRFGSPATPAAITSTPSAASAPQEARPLLHVSFRLPRHYATPRSTAS